MTEYIHTVYPTAWCSECGPGNCKHTQRMNKSLIESFMETKNAPPRKRKPRPDYPVWVCSPCGCGIATWHEDDCGVCGQRGMVTEPRDFGHLKDGWEMEKRK